MTSTQHDFLTSADSLAATLSAHHSVLVRRSMQERSNRGEWMHLAPLGFRNVRSRDGKSIIEPDPVSYSLVRQAFALQMQGVTLREISHRLNVAGLRSKRGNPLTPGSLAKTLQAFKRIQRSRPKEATGTGSVPQSAAIAYIRTKRPEDVAKHEAAINRFAKECGLGVAYMVVEEPRFATDRPGLMQLRLILSDPEHSIRWLIVPAVHHLTRSLDEAGELLLRLEEAGVSVVVADQTSKKL